MSGDRLPTWLFVDAHLRRLGRHAIFHYVIQKGDPHSGMVMLKINTLAHGCIVLRQERDLEGKFCWVAALDGKRVAEAQADEYIARSRARDPDLWVIEVEQPDGTNPFEEQAL